MENHISMNGIIRKILSFDKKYSYQILFMISIILGHSTDFYLMGYGKENSVTIYYSILDHISFHLIQAIFILRKFILNIVSTIIISIIMIKSIIKNTETYLF
jgi:hypothetical protein